MDKSEILSSMKNKENSEHFLGRHVYKIVATTYYVQCANADADVGNLKYAINKLAFGYD